MKKFFFGAVPIVALLLGGIWYQRSSERAIEYERKFQILKVACEDSAGKEVKSDEAITEYVNGICGCFAKSALNHRGVSVASIVGDQKAVHSLLRDCSIRVPASNP